MNDAVRIATSVFQLGCKITPLYTLRLLSAQNAFLSSAQTAAAETLSAIPAGKEENTWQAWTNYVIDSFQRSILFWDTLRQRGNNFLEHERAGKPPLLVYDYETIVDGRKLERPVNYALVRIIPPQGVVVDERKRPFIIVDPRAGHGPGIGGFKQDSQVGVALKAGHPVYFVIFFARPEPGQTLPDVFDAEAKFVQTVADRHPHSPKPAVVGNCQGGWSAMLLAASHPDITGPVVINGAPMSYWSGSWHGGEGENPMRYLGGLMGGSWLALLTSDLGNGLVDGAHFVANFERLNPANTLWSKYYHLFANVDTEPPRFLDFERWWGGYSLMNEAELRWILDNLFVGNRLARGEAKAAPHTFFDLKAIRSPIIVFSSAGDNITPPQQALNWIADAYSTTEEIKANGQVKEKVDIVQNAIDLAHVLGIEEPKVAILSAVETVNPEIDSTLEAAALCKMAERGQITGGVLDGPLAFDNAISVQAAQTKKIHSPVAGQADILVVPDLEAGNMLAKQLSYLAGADGAGIVLGTRVPSVLTSRADSVRTRLASTVVMALVAHARRAGKFPTR
jgi:pimeloyl-ACP methyl ester carboxylesterase